MPLINDENLLLVNQLEQIRQKVFQLEIGGSSDFYYSKVAALTPMVQKFQVIKCSDDLVRNFIDKIFVILVSKLGQKKYIEIDKLKQNKNLVKLLLQKAIQVFSINKMYNLAVKALKQIFKNRDNVLFYPDHKVSWFGRSSASPYRERDDKQLQVSQFYIDCTLALREGFFGQIKQIWNMPIEDITELIDLFAYLQKYKNKKTYNTQLLQGYFSQFYALIQSGRERLIQFANYEKIMNLIEAFQKGQQFRSKKEQSEKIIPTLAKTLLSQSYKHKLAAVKILNRNAKKVTQDNYYCTDEKFKQQLCKNDIFSLLLTKDFTEQEYDQSNYLFKFFTNSAIKVDKTKFILQLLKDQVRDDKWFVKFCLKQINVYNATPQEKSAILKYLQQLPNLSERYLEYSQCIDDFLYRHQNYESLFQRLFKLISKLMKQAYLGLNETNQRKLMHNFKSSIKGLKLIISKLHKQQKSQYLKQYVKNLLQNIHEASIIIFNVVFDDSDLRGNFGNTEFANIINYFIEELNIFDKVFAFLEVNSFGEQINKEIAKLLKYVSNKCSIKVDITDKYIKILANHPQIYESLISSQGYGKIKNQMEKLLDLFRVQPDLAFHILKLIFIKSNHNRISDSSKVPNLLQNKAQQGKLRCHPKVMQWYEQLISLLQQTNSPKLRHQLAQFLVLLSINFTPIDAQNNLDEIKYMNQMLLYFQENTKNYRAKKASKNSVLANFQLILEMIQATDILGVGAYKPHKSLVSTSTITLTILNNVTFGDDVQKSITRNFPINMVLFDLLAIVGQKFKSGPQDIVLIQGKRFIPIIYNGRVLQDIKFTNAEIIAEKNQANMTKTPEIFTKKDELSQVYVRCLRQVFHRFAYEGKMGQIECMNYLRQVGDTYISATDRKLKEIMQQYDKDNDGILTFDDFLNYNTKKLTGYYSKYYSEQFKKGLINLRYRKNMTLYTEPLDISCYYDMMMRCRIAKESSIYAELFKYTQDGDKEIAEKAKELLLYLPTWQVLKQNAVEFADFSSKSEFFIFYELILIENELNKRSGQSIEEIRNYKRQKITQFIGNKYNQIIFELMLKFYSQINTSPFSYKCFALCLKILRSLIDIENLIESNIEKIQYSPDSIHSLPQTNFFAEEIIKALQTKNSINFEVLLVLQLTQQSIDLSPIIQSCFHNDQQIRKACCNFIYLWQQRIGWKDDLFEVKIKEVNMIEWFDLLCIIIQKTNKFQLNKVLSNTISIIGSREETLYNRYDQLMHGYLKLLKVILAKSKKLGDSKPLQNLIEKLIIKTISSQNRTVLYDILTILNDQVLIQYFNYMLTNTLPSQQCEIRTKYVGLKNLGAICYINSIIQQFFMIQEFRYLVLNREVPTDCKQVEVNGKIIVDDFMYQLQKIYQNLHSSQKKYYVPKEFCYSYKDFDGKPINTSIQQDSHQFLNRLIQNVEQACKKDGSLDRLRSLCEIKTLSQYECGQCQNRIDKIQNHYSCMLQVKEQNSLAKSLAKFNKTEQIQGYTCQNCKKKVKKISKRTFLHELPEVVILNLQRIIYDQKKGDKIKVHSELTFPMEINFQEFIKHSNLANMNTKYRLKGVVIHTGTSEGGHYYSLIRDSRSQKWFKFNDQAVVEFDQKEIARQSFGGYETKDHHFEEISYSTNAYILFYQNFYAQKADHLQAENNLSEQVQKQNQSLINQIQIHQQTFFAAICHLYEKHRLKNIEIMMKNQPFSQNTLKKSDKSLYQKLLQVHLKASFFLSVFSGVNVEVKMKINKNLQELYFLLPQESNKYLNELNLNTFIQNLISHSDVVVRQSLKNLFFRNFKIFIQYYGVQNIYSTKQRPQCTLILKLLDYLVYYLTDNLLYSNMSKSAFFLVLLLQLQQLNPQIKYILMKKELFFKLLDLLMGRQSFYMKYHPKAQDLSTQIAFVVLQIISKMIHYKNNIRGIKFKHQNIDLNYKTSSLQAKILMSPIFYKRIFRLHYNHHLLIPLICHYSVEDIDYTVLISDIWIQQINKHDQGNLELLFIQIYAILTIQDHLRELRWSFLVGIPQYTEVRQNCFCLNHSDKSQNTSYISGLYPNKDDRFRFQSDRKPLLQIIFGQKNYRMQNLVLHSLVLLTTLAEALDDFFDYLLKIPPSNYMKMSIFEFIPQIASKLLQAQDFIIDNKIQKMNLVMNLSQIIEQKLKIKEKNLPVKKYIIGKNKETEEVSLLQQNYISATLRRFETYVLENIPLGQENKSMPKHFNDGKGLSTLFLDSRYNLNASQDKIEGKKKMPTLYVFKGKAKNKLLMRFKNQIFNYTILLNQGQFNINMPFYKEGKIDDFVTIEIYQDPQFQQVQEQIDHTFKLEQEVKKPQENGKMKVQKNQMKQGKIQCPNCTLLNQLTNQRCQVCDSLLFM